MSKETYTIMDLKTVRRYKSESEDEIVTVVPLSHGRFCLVFDDAYEMSVFKPFVGEKSEIEEKFNIIL